MKNVLAATTVALAMGIASTAYADIVKAPVVTKSPITKTTKVVTGYTTHCNKERIYDHRKNEGSVFDGASNALKGDGNSLAGAIIGGVVGNQFGGGNGKTAMTVLGTIVGSNIGNGTSKDKPHSRVVTVCDDVPTTEIREKVVGCNVTYQFEGSIYTVQMDRDPGAYVQLETYTNHTVRK